MHYRSRRTELQRAAAGDTEGATNRLDLDLSGSEVDFDFEAHMQEAEEEEDGEDPMGGGGRPGASALPLQGAQQ